MTDPTPFERAYHDQLLRLPLRPPRRRWRWGVAVAGAIGGTLLGLLAVVNPSPAAADVEVTIEDGQVEVLLTDLTSTPRDVAEAVEEAGLHARVIAQPAGPSNVGRFVQVRVDGDPTIPIVRLQAGVNTFMGFTLPEHWNGTLVIALGRPAREGEPYALASDAFAEGEPLHCSGLRGETLGDAAPRLRDLQVRVQDLVDGHITPPVVLTDEVLRARSSEHVVGALALSPDEVIVQLAERPERGGGESC